MSLIGEQWSPKMLPSSTAPMVISIIAGPPMLESCPTVWARTTTLGRRIAMVPYEVPVLKATKELSRNSTEGSIQGLKLSPKAVSMPRRIWAW